MPGSVVMRDPKGRIQLTATVTALLNELRSRDDVDATWLLSMAQGNHYNQLGMLSPDGPFDFVLPGREDLPFEDGATLVPYGAMHHTLSEVIDEIPLYLELLSKSSFTRRTIIFGPPPPARDEYHFAALQAAAASPEPLTPPFVRLKLWHLQNRIYADLCRKNGLLFASGKLDAIQDRDGFLRPELVKDAVHANATWAKIYLRRIAEIILETKGAKS